MQRYKEKKTVDICYKINKKKDAKKGENKIYEKNNIKLINKYRKKI